MQKHRRKLEDSNTRIYIPCIKGTKKEKTERKRESERESNLCYVARYMPFHDRSLYFCFHLASVKFFFFFVCLEFFFSFG